MEINIFFFGSIILFAIIYFAVRLAVNPLLYKSEEVVTYKQEGELLKLRDIDVLSPSEFEEVIKLYQKKDAKKQVYEEYERNAKVLNELKEIGYFNDEEYSYRIDKLKKYFKVS